MTKEEVREKLEKYRLKVSNLDTFYEILIDHAKIKKMSIDESFNDLIVVKSKMDKYKFLNDMSIVTIKRIPDLPKPQKQTWKRPYKFHK